ncbi:hypothetical protein ACM66B_004509 [Microbotryomycetes sp. NB124-2]
MVAVKLLAALPLLASVAHAGCHRRHHGSATSSSSSSSSSNGASATRAVLAAQSTSSPSSSSGSSSAGSLGWGLKGLWKNDIAFGWLPDDGSGGGTSQTIQQIESSMGAKTSAQGWYAQAQSGTLFDGQQLLWRMDQIETGGVFQPAVMPTGGWWGLTHEDNQQAVAICNVMKQFTDKGIEVWLRFAHEVNYYQQDGTYQGTAEDFKTGWDVVAKACRQIAPEVKMWFTPNIADESEYDAYYPDDPTTVDLIGIDYYPKQTSNFDFVERMKPFHDKYTNDRVKFAIGEIGLGVEGDMNARYEFLQNMLSTTTKQQMPNYIACSWFNYWKGYEFRIAALNGDSVIKNYFS